MSEKLTAEEYSESEMFLKSILNSQIAIAMTPSDLAIYKKLVAKEAVEKFERELIEKYGKDYKSRVDERIIVSAVRSEHIKHLAKQHGAKIIKNQSMKQKTILKWLNELPELIREVVIADYICNTWCYINESNKLSSAIMDFSWDQSALGPDFYCALYEDALYHEQNNLKLPR